LTLKGRQNLAIDQVNIIKFVTFLLKSSKLQLKILNFKGKNWTKKNKFLAKL
jgi:hypothetical protein